MPPLASAPTSRSVLRGLVVLGWATWLWSVGVAIVSAPRIARPWLAVLLLAVVLATDVVATVIVTRPQRHMSAGLVAVPVVVGFVLLAAEGWAFEPGQAFAGRQGLAGGWPVVGVIAAGLVLGPGPGAGAGVVVGLGRVVGALANGVRTYDADRVASLAATIAFFAVYGGVAGWVGRLLRRAEAEVAVTRAREEVARTLHDGVLQTLALVARRSADTDPVLARAARDSDRDLRAFLAGRAREAGDDRLGPALREAALRAARPFDLDVSVSVVDDEVRIDPAALAALTGAVGEAVTNVGKHAGASHAVVFAEQDEAGVVRVSVRDDGCGFAPEATTAAASSCGRGVARSIVDRMTEVGGGATVVSRPGHGTEVRLWTA